MARIQITTIHHPQARGQKLTIPIPLISNNCSPKILRSAGIRRYSRTSCAGLFGEEWLTWLQEHDKNGGFDWKKAAFLAEIPYRPESMNGVSQYKIQALISASITWIQVRGSDVDGVE
jgi:hypothetical protein